MKKVLIEGRCKEPVYDRTGRFSFSQCTRKPVKDGYCKQHHPDTLQAKRVALEAKWEADRKRRQEAYKRSPEVMLPILLAASRKALECLELTEFDRDGNTKVITALRQAIEKIDGQSK